MPEKKYTRRELRDHLKKENKGFSVDAAGGIYCQALTSSGRRKRRAVDYCIGETDPNERGKLYRKRGELDHNSLRSGILVDSVRVSFFTNGPEEIVKVRGALSLLKILDELGIPYKFKEEEIKRTTKKFLNLTERLRREVSKLERISRELSEL